MRVAILAGCDVLDEVEIPNNLSPYDVGKVYANITKARSGIKRFKDKLDAAIAAGTIPKGSLRGSNSRIIPLPPKQPNVGLGGVRQKKWNPQSSEELRQALNRGLKKGKNLREVCAEIGTDKVTYMATRTQLHKQTCGDNPRWVRYGKPTYEIGLTQFGQRELDAYNSMNTTAPQDCTKPRDHNKDQDQDQW